MRTETVVVVD